MSRLLISTLLLFTLFGCASDKPTGTPETRVVDYLSKNVTPGKPVLVTELLNDVFTTPEDQQAVKRLYDALFLLPAYVARTYTDTSKIPSLKDIATHFDFQVPGTTEVLIRILESDPRVPRFFERNASTGEITEVHVDTIRGAERFGKPLENPK